MCYLTQSLHVFVHYESFVTDHENFILLQVLLLPTKFNLNAVDFQILLNINKQRNKVALIKQKEILKKENQQDLHISHT